MKKCSIGMERFRAAGGVKMEKQKDGYLLTFPEKGGRLILAGDSMRLGGVDWTEATHLVFEMTTFAKVDLEPGEEREVSVEVTAKDLCVYDPSKGVVLPVGEYKMYVGTDCRTILHEADLRVLGKNVYCLGRESSLGDILAVAEAVAAVETVIPGFVTRLGDHAKLMAGNNFDAMFSKHIIQSQPDSVKAKEIMDRMYAELEKIEM